MVREVNAEEFWALLKESSRKGGRRRGRCPRGDSAARGGGGIRRASLCNLGTVLLEGRLTRFARARWRSPCGDRLLPVGRAVYQ